MSKAAYIGVGSKARKIKAIYVGDASGKARRVTAGYVGVGGKARQFFAAGTPAGDLQVGGIVKLSVGGVLRDFLIVHKGLPSNLYDASCDGVWLLMKDCYTSMAFGGYKENSYDASPIHSYLNNEFFALLDSRAQSAVQPVKIPYRPGEGTDNDISSGAQGLSSKVFLLSVMEAGAEVYANIRGTYSTDGAMLDYFQGLKSMQEPKRVAYLNGTACDWWLRSSSTITSNSAMRITTEGNYGADAPTAVKGIRPALILPKSVAIGDDGSLIG